MTKTKSTLVYTQPVSLVLLFKCVQLILFLFIYNEDINSTVYILFIFFKSNQIEFDLKNINQEFLLFPKSLNKHSIQYFIV